MSDLDGDGKNDLLLAQGNGFVNYYLNKTTTTSAVHDISFALKVYPNPVVNVLYVKNTSAQPTKYEIIDLQGRVVKQGTFGVNKRSINVSRLNPGVYIIKLSDGKNIIRTKFVKM
jgi:hypothetical protein